VPWESKMALWELRDKARRGFLEFTWRQWAQAGLSANVTAADRWAIDPEALIIFTIEVARRDPRLFDEMLDWLTVNRRLLSMQRLRNLTARFPVDPDLVGAVLTWAGEPVPTPRGLKHDQRPEHASVFSADVLSFIGEPDPAFVAHGYIRPRAIRSGKSSEPDTRLPVNLAFQLRHLFGPGSRSEVMRILLTYTDGPLDAARISDEAGFAKRNVSDTLTSLTASRAVKARWSGNERVFIAYRTKWATLLEVGPSAAHMPAFVSWVHLLPASLHILAWLEKETGTADSEYLTSSRARELIAHLAPSLEAAGLTPPSDQLPGTAYLPAFTDIIESLLTTMRAGQLASRSASSPRSPDAHDTGRPGGPIGADRPFGDDIECMLTMSPPAV
jgi:hypothetical protein